ncbi:MAG: hypothetical protein CM15mP120_02080 [Pseudomonadota bacterium]|nr:MAG: hypothetical protein CM15mP120_02080 [Pseudomonadota bacterium]
MERQIPLGPKREKAKWRSWKSQTSRQRFLDRLQEAFEQRLQVEKTRYTKPTFFKPAPDALGAEINSANDFV